MSQRIIYTCDKCGTETNNPNQVMIQNMGSKYMSCSIDLCDDCAETFVAKTINFLSTECPMAQVDSYLNMHQYEETPTVDEMPIVDEMNVASNYQQSADVIDSITYNQKEDKE